MKSSLYTRLNLESDDSIVTDNTQIASAELNSVDVDGTEILNTAIALESAAVMLDNIDEAAFNLAQSGVDPTTVTNVLAPVTVAVIATVDSEMAQKAEEENVISLEADDTPGLWASIRERAKKIWEAFKSMVLRFWNWVMSFFRKQKDVDKQMGAAIKQAEARVKECGETSVAIEVPSKTRWTIDNEPVVPTAFIKNVDSFKRTFTIASTGMFTMVRKQYDYLHKRIDVFATEMRRVAGLGQNAGHEAVENRAQIAAMYAAETEKIRKLMDFKGQHPILGYYQVNGGGRMLLSSGSSEGKVITFKGTGELLAFNAALERLRKTSATNEANYKRVMRSVDSIVADMAKMVDVLNIKSHNPKLIKGELAFQSQMMLASMNAIRDFIGGATTQAVFNGAGLVVAATRILNPK